LSATAVHEAHGFDPMLDAAPEWGSAELNALRKAAAERFAEAGLPTLKNEEWKYTSVKPIAARAYRLGGDPGTAQALPELPGVAARAVVVDGVFVPELSSLDALPADVAVGPLREACEHDWADIAEHLGRIADWKGHPFAALNTAHLNNGVVLRIGDGVALNQPIHVVFVATKGRVAHPRLLLIAGEESSFSVIAHAYAEEDALLNLVEEAWIGARACVRLSRVQDAADSGALVSLFTGRVDTDAECETVTITLGGGLVRNDSGLVLAGENIHATLDGLYLATRKHHVDHHTFLDHTMPNCNSFETYKGILDGEATGVFNGKIFVRPGAQKTDSKQSNMNLLLSRGATVNSKPQLEIFADDVKCTHGATIGQLEPGQLFYLRTRGIPAETARKILTFAFANEIIGKIPHEPLRQRLEEEIFERFTSSGTNGP
jgi:Fe-S cluster assembly protein SufD